MAEQTTYDIPAAHRYFAKRYNNGAWDLIEQPTRNAVEDERLLAAAYASWAHWSEVGTPLNVQRARYLMASAHSALGLGALALRHAEALQALSEVNGDAQSAFDRAAVAEGLARANAAAGNRDVAVRLLRRAEVLATAIPDDERSGFLSLLRSGPWYGVE